MSDVRKNWTARGNLRFETNIVNDNSWITSLRTVEQLGTPGLEGDVWRVQLENSPDGDEWQYCRDGRYLSPN